MAIVFQLHRQTHVAHLAVEEARPAADSANSAPITVVLRAVLVVEQVAHQTGVLAEPDAALFALRLDALPGVALGADQLRHGLPIEEVRFVLVVTVPAHVELVTARCLKGEERRQCYCLWAQFVWTSGRTRVTARKKRLKQTSYFSQRYQHQENKHCGRK